MARTALKYSAVLIGLYLVAYWGSNAGQVIDHATAGGAKVVATFQGR